MRVFASLGRFSHRYRWWVLGCWLLVLVAGGVLSGNLFDRLRTVDGLSASAEAVRAEQRIQALVADGPVIYAVLDGVQPDSPQVAESAATVARAIAKLPGVHSVDSPYTGPGGRFGLDNRSALVVVELDEGLDEQAEEAIEDDVRARLRTIAAPSVLIGGDHLAQRAFGDQAGRDLAVGESVAFAALIVALLIIFGGVAGAAVPLVVAVVGVSATLLVLLGLSTVTAVGEYSLNIVTLLGLGLAVDYALLIVARVREERAGGADVATAVETAMARAGRAVAISGLAVAAALLGLTAFAEPLLASMALGGTAVALLTTAIALTAVPAMVSVLGERLPPAGATTWVSRLLRVGSRRAGNAPPPGRGSQPGRAPLLARLARTAQRHPGPVALAGTLGLLVLALPLTHAAFGNSDVRALPASVEERQAYERYQANFGQGEAAPVTVVAGVDATSPQLRDYLNRLNRQPDVHRLTLRPDVPAGAVIIDLTPPGVTGGAESRALVREIRDTRPPFAVLVGGEAAKVVDYEESVTARLPYAVGVVVLAMLVLLFALTGSALIPVKAVLLNALTFLASLGVLVAVFGWGWGEPVLRFQSWGALDLTTPLLLFVFIFGLTMDYEVFLLSRIKEEYDLRPDNDRAVLAGITRSGPVVTAAAVCITIVFLGFAAGGLVAVKEIGVGMAVAVVLDVTVVRGLLLPAAMSLFGDLNWWSPRRRSPVRVAATVGK